MLSGEASKMGRTCFGDMHRPSGYSIAYKGCKSFGFEGSLGKSTSELALW